MIFNLVQMLLKLNIAFITVFRSIVVGMLRAITGSILIGLIFDTVIIVNDFYKKQAPVFYKESGACLILKLS